MTDVVVDVLAEWGVVPQDVVSLSVVCPSWSVRNVECSCIRFRQVLFDMAGRLGRMMLCPMKGMIAVCLYRRVCSLW